MRFFNKRARHDYHILETVEAGLVLSGAEVKAIRGNRVDLNASFARIQNGEVFLKNLYLPINGLEGYDPRGDRKLLLHKSQIHSLLGKVSGAAVTLIPLSIYEKKNMFKVDLALAASKKKYDKRRAIKEKDLRRKLEQETSF